MVKTAAIVDKMPLMMSNVKKIRSPCLPDTRRLAARGNTHDERSKTQQRQHKNQRHK